MPTDGPFVLPHMGLQSFASFAEILNRALAAFKAVDDIQYLVWFQGVFGSHQGGVEARIFPVFLRFENEVVRNFLQDDFLGLPEHT